RRWRYRTLMQAVEKANCSTRALPRLLWRKALSEDDGRSRVTSNALRITQVAPKTCMAVMRSRSRNTASSRTKTLLTRRKGAGRDQRREGKLGPGDAAYEADERDHQERLHDAAPEGKREGVGASGRGMAVEEIC